MNPYLLFITILYYFNTEKDNMKVKRSILIVALFALTISCISIPLVTADSGDKQLWAVVIGVEGGGAINLDNDAQDFANVLVNTYGYPSSNIRLLINSEATKSAVISTLEWLRDQEVKQDGVSIFFSTHGSVDNLHLYDAFLSDSELSSILSEFDSHNILVVINACNSGSFTDVADVIESGILLTACTADESTYDVVFFSNTIFIEYLVEQGMSQGLADGNSDGIVSVEEAFNYAYANCADPPGALSPTHPQMVDKYEGEYLLSSPVHTPWFSNLMAVMAISVFGYAVYTKKISIKTSS
jgi:hypothetical protein